MGIIVPTSALSDHEVVYCEIHLLSGDLSIRSSCPRLSIASRQESRYSLRLPWQAYSKIKNNGSVQRIDKHVYNNFASKSLFSIRQY